MLISSENTRREISTFAVFFIQSLVTNLSFFGIFLLLGFGHLPNLQQSLHHGAATHSRAHHGRMAEWLIVPPWKGGIRKFRIEGSNPSPSARIAYLDELVSSRRAKRASYNGHYLSFPS